MTLRVVAVCARPTVDDATLALAMLEDVVDLLEGMQQVLASVIVDAATVDMAHSVGWPGMPVVTCDGVAARQLVDSLVAVEATEAAIVAPDVPDLPPLLLGKLFSALTTAQAAVCPAADGRLVALAAQLPAPAWLAEVGLDSERALDQLQGAAPPGALHVGSGWARTSSVAAASRLDPGLEGWEATREWLSRRAR